MHEYVRSNRVDRHGSVNGGDGKDVTKVNSKYSFCAGMLRYSYVSLKSFFIGERLDALPLILALELRNLVLLHRIIILGKF